MQAAMGGTMPGRFLVLIAAGASAVTANIAIPRPAPPFRAFAFSPNTTEASIYAGANLLASASGTHLDMKGATAMLSFGMIPVQNAPGPTLTAKRCAHPTSNPNKTQAFNRSACVASMSNSMENGTNAQTGIQWSGRALNEWTLHNATTVDYPNGTVNSTVDVAAIAAEGYRLARKNNPAAFLSAWITNPDDTFASLMADGTFDLAMVEGYSYCPNASGVVDPNSKLCSDSVDAYLPRLYWAREQGFINRTIFFFGWLIARSPLHPGGWTTDSLRSQAVRLKKLFPEMPGMGLYTSGRTEKPTTPEQWKLISAGAKLMADLYPDAPAT